ncbi:unnamed protein product [Trichobilharzia regenti]|nr:unnamed protein product [Trichobilharzia regenti]
MTITSEANNNNKMVKKSENISSNNNNINSHVTNSESEAKRRESLIDANRKRQRELIEKQRVGTILYSHILTFNNL